MKREVEEKDREEGEEEEEEEGEVTGTNKEGNQASFLPYLKKGDSGETPGE